MRNQKALQGVRAICNYRKMPELKIYHPWWIIDNNWKELQELSKKSEYDIDYFVNCAIEEYLKKMDDF